MSEKKLSRRERRERQLLARRRTRRLRWSAVVGIVVLLVGGILAFNRAQDDTASSAAGMGQVSSANIEGPPDAPVQIVEFADFGCPSCRAWHNSGIKERLLEEFGGEINFTFRHLPVITRQSPKAAEAAQWAADQDAFWQYHDFLYERAPPGGLGVEALKQYGAALGLDSQAFNSCLDLGRHPYVQQDLQAGFELGARGTPSFFVNGQPANLFSYESAVATIRAELD